MIQWFLSWQVEIHYSNQSEKFWQVLLWVKKILFPILMKDCQSLCGLKYIKMSQFIYTQIKPSKQNLWGFCLKWTHFIFLQSLALPGLHNSRPDGYDCHGDTGSSGFRWGWVCIALTETILRKSLGKTSLCRLQKKKREKPVTQQEELHETKFVI